MVKFRLSKKINIETEVISAFKLAKDPLEKIKLETAKGSTYHWAAMLLEQIKQQKRLDVLETETF